jgi:hypothetical protein
MYALPMRKGLNPIVCAKFFDQFFIRSKPTILFLAKFPSFQSEKSDFDLLTRSIFYDKTKYLSNPKPFALCRNVNGGRLICHNCALGASNHFEKRNAFGGGCFH